MGEYAINMIEKNEKYLIFTFHKTQLLSTPLFYFNIEKVDRSFFNLPTFIISLH